MKTEYISINEIKINPDNPRTITRENQDKLINSLLVFPRMLEIRPIVIDDNNIVLGGNQRTKALNAIAKMEITTIRERLEGLNDFQRMSDTERSQVLSFWSGWKQSTPVIKASELTEEEKQQFIIKDNAPFGDWNWDVLESWDAELLEDWGLEIPEDWNTEKKKQVEEDEYKESDAQNSPQRVQRGEIWQLGEHRLMCGDSTVKEDVSKLMNGEKADLVFTDPPYGMKKEKDGVLNDNLNFDDLLEFNKKWIPLTFDNLKDNGSWYCWGIDEPLMDIYSNILKPMIKQNKITFRNLITWNKGAFGSGGGTGVGQAIQRSYFPSDEKCLFVMCGVQGFSNNSDNYFEKWEPIRLYLVGEAEKVGLTPNKLKDICGVGMYSHWFTKSQFLLITEEHYKKLKEYYKSYAFKKEYDEIKKEYDEIKKEYYSTRAYFDNTHDMMTNIWDFGRCKGEERSLCGGHASPKPLALCQRAIKSSSREEGKVLDVFGGSGSTLIACEQLNRKCYMMELSEHYCDVIINRWEKLTGKEAVKIYGKVQERNN